MAVGMDRHERSPRVLIINPFGIGDVLFTTPVIRAIRRAFPDSRMGYLCNKRTAPILRTNPHLDELFIYEKDELLALWKSSKRKGIAYLHDLLGGILRSRYEVAVDLSLGERYALVLALLGVRRRIGLNYRGRGRFLTERLGINGYQGQHVVRYGWDLLRFMGVELLQENLELGIDEDDRRWAEQWMDAHGAGSAAQRPMIGIVPAGGISWGVGAPYRRWHTEGFATVADALVEHHGATIVIFGEQADIACCATMQEAMRHRAINASGQTTLGQFIALLDRMDLVLCNDGGPLHLAVGRRVRTVSIFGPVDPVVYGPHPADRSRHRVVVNRGLACQPCYHQFHVPPCPYERACLRDLSPEEVLDACETLLLGRVGQGAHS